MPAALFFCAVPLLLTLLFSNFNQDKIMFEKFEKFAISKEEAGNVMGGTMTCHFLISPLSDETFTVSGISAEFAVELCETGGEICVGCF